MRAAQSKIGRRQIEAREKMIANRARGAETLCGIAGCKRHAYKGRICRKHYALVPYSSRMQLTMDCYRAQLAAARRGHSRMLRELRVALKSGTPSA